MNIKEFYDLGFKLDFVDDAAINREVKPYDAHYQEIFEYAQTHTYKEVEDYAWKYQYRLNSINSSGYDNDYHITSVNMHFVDAQSHRVIIAFEDIRLDIYCDRKTGFIHSIWDRFSYMNAWVVASSYKMYEYKGTKAAMNFSNSEYYIHDAKEFITYLLKERQEDAQAIRNHFNKELKKIKEDYKYRLSLSHLGTKSLNKLIV